MSPELKLATQIPVVVVAGLTIGWFGAPYFDKFFTWLMSGRAK